jgi:hypothetical protein
MLMAINLVLHTVDKLLREAVFVCLFEITWSIQMLTWVNVVKIKTLKSVS